MAGVVVLTGSGEGQIVLVEDQDKVFIAKAWRWVATDKRFDVKYWRDAANNSWLRGKTATDLLAGENLYIDEWGFQPLPLPIVVYSVTQHTIDLIDRSGGGNTVRLALLGEEMTSTGFIAKYPDIAASLGLAVPPPAKK